MTIRDLLFPKFCLGCGLVGIYICQKCFKRIPPVKNTTCVICGKESANSPNHHWCLKRLNVDNIVSIFRYKGLLRKIIKNTKYRLAREILEDFLKNIGPDQLGQLMKIKKDFHGALIQPIPLSKKRLKVRGFNQAYIIGKYFSSVLGLKMANYMVRKSDNTPQAELKTREERYKNVRGVFGLRPGARIKNKKIILVDDVVTTGMTIKEAAGVLRKSGACEVFALSLTKD